MFNGDFIFFTLLHYFSLHLFKFKSKSFVSYFTATLLLFDNLMFRGKSLKYKKLSRIVIFILSKKNRDSHFIQNRAALWYTTIQTRTIIIPCTFAYLWYLEKIKDAASHLRFDNNFPLLLHHTCSGDNIRHRGSLSSLSHGQI